MLKHTDYYMKNGLSEVDKLKQLIVDSKKTLSSDNNVFTLRGIRPSVRWKRSNSIEVIQISRKYFQRTHPFTQPRSRPAEIVLVARLVQLRVNGRREHGKVSRYPLELKSI